MSTANRMTPQKVSKKQQKKQRKQVQDEEVDYLDVDRPIPGQSFACMSFLSPEAAIKERYMWYLKEFLNDLVSPIPQPDDMPDIEYKTKLHSILMRKFSYNGISNIWEDFLYNKREELNKKYDDEVDFQTSTRGIKLRGIYDSYREAKNRSNQIAKFDNKHHVYIGQVGYWLPWDPDPHEVQDQEYQEKELNTLMKKYRENLINKDEFFTARNEEKMTAALKQNKRARRAKEEDKKELEKVRRTVTEKDTLLNAALEERHKKSKESISNPEDRPEQETETKELISDEKEVKVAPAQTTTDTTPLSGAFSSSVDPKAVSAVFDTEDPWLQRKTAQAKVAEVAKVSVVEELD